MAINETFEKPVFFIKEDKYSGIHAPFCDRSQFPAADILEAHWHIIKDEMLQGLPPQVSSPTYNPNQEQGADKWKMIIFYNYLWKKKKNCEKFPRTFELISRIDGLTYAALNLLEPHSDIIPHYGDTNTTIRCHLGIEIPAPLPDCGLEVDGRAVGWENGKIILFSDAHKHRAWNHSNGKRYVFVIDIIRPEYADQKKWICAGVLSSLTVKTLATKLHLVGVVPYFIVVPLYFSLRLAWWLKLSLS